MATSNRGIASSVNTMRTRSGRRGIRAALALITLLTPGCTVIDNALAAVPIFAFMREAPSFDPYEDPLPPPPGSVPYMSGNGEVLAPLEASEAAFAAFEASPQGQNPLALDDPAALELGGVMYARHCSVCHGAEGAGDGPVASVYGAGFVPPLTSGTAMGLSDAYVYAVIRAGRARMPSYGARMTHLERWAVVNYVNALQAAAGAPAPDQGAAPAPPAQGVPPADTTVAPAAPPTQQ